LAYTGANPEREAEKDAARQEEGDQDKSNPSKQKIDMSSAKLVGLYLISDILASSATSGVPKGWRYRSLFEAALRSHKVFEHLGRLEKELSWGRLRAEKWKRSVGTLLHLWEGWSIFQPANQEHFLKVLEQPPLTEEEMQKEIEKANAERAAQLASKSKSRWKTVDDDPASNNLDSDRPPDAENPPPPMADAAAVEEDESMSDLDGIPMQDSDLEMLDDDGEPMDEDVSPQHEAEAPPSVPDQSSQPEQGAGHQEEELRRPRRPRPKAEDMFASDSE
jgi:U2-associated protein SR140